MAKKRVPEEVQVAMDLARKAGWDVSIRNDKIKIVVPDEKGTCVTIGMNPNDESLKVFRSQARTFNLMGDGPARTPGESEQILRDAEAAGKAQADAANQQRMAYEAEQAFKRAEAEEAAKKAAAATAKGMAAPVGLVTAVVGKSSSSFPEFCEALLGTMDYSQFELPGNGGFYCIECLQVGVEFTAKKPQGLATHRGFRHQMYQGENVASAPSNPILETTRVQLPHEVQDAFELLRSIVGEHVATVDASARVAELEGLLAKSDEGLSNAVQQLQELKDEFAKERETCDQLTDSQKERIHELTQELHGKDGLHKAEIEGLLTNVQKLLTEIRSAVNNLSPAQAVGKVDELVSSYLGS